MEEGHAVRVDSREGRKTLAVVFLGHSAVSLIGI